MLDWWNSLEPTLRAASITASTTALTGVVGFAVVVFQLGRQSRNAIRQSQLNEALKLKLQVYQQTLGVSRSASDAIQELTSYLRGFETDLKFVRLAQSSRLSWAAPTARFPDYQKLSREATDAIIGVITMIENWHIVEPKLDIFRRAISMGIHKLSTVTTSERNVLIYAMPVEGYLPQWRPPDEKSMSAIYDRVRNETYFLDLLSAWVGDFQVEMQMLLLGDLFPNKVERRDPPDPDQFCIRLDRYDEIDRRINESDWGKYAAELEVEAWNRFSQSQSGTS